MKRLLMILTCFTVVVVSQAQAPDQTWKASMEKLNPLVGDWTGEGWVQMGPDGRSTFIVREGVAVKVGGRALLIQGIGHAKTADGSEGRVVHEALAVVSWDPATESYRFDAHSAQGGRVEASLVIEEAGKWVWGFETTRGNVRYTLSVDGGHWTEVGEFLPSNAEDWVQFMEMKLERVR